MNEEMNTELVEIENTEVETCNEPEKSGSGIVGKLIIGGGIVAAGVAAWLYKTKDQREAKQISKLVKKGYVIYKPEDEEDFDDEVVIEADSESEEPK